MKLNLNTIKTIKTKVQTVKDSLEILETSLEPAVNKYKQVAKERGIKASFDQLIKDNPAVANQLYALKQTTKSFAKASISDKMLLVKDIKAIYKYAKTACPLNTPKLKGMHKELEIRSCNETVFFFMGVLPHQPAAALVKPPTGEVFILVNEGFYQMEVEHQLAILDHEYGHYVFDHLSLSKGARDFNHELEADAYSASLGNDMIGALKALGANNVLIRNQEEIALRIKALKT